MPELPEVQTTVNGIKPLAGLQITDVWTSYDSKYYYGKETVKDPEYFRKFRKIVAGAKILGAKRRAKYVLIELNNGYTIVTHMKMTGHYLYGEYKYKGGKWTHVKDGPLNDSFNTKIRLIFTLSNGKTLALSDTRRFANVFIIKDEDFDKHEAFRKLGPEPLSPTFTYSVFKKILENPKVKNKKIKSVLMDQTIIAGIGNIYSDEVLWLSGIHPETTAGEVLKISDRTKEIFRAIKLLLKKGINFGGDSMSDYRNIRGERGRFQNEHKVYKRKGEKCLKPGCKGKIIRIAVGGRSAHLCDLHQKMF